MYRSKVSGWRPRRYRAAFGDSLRSGCALAYVTLKAAVPLLTIVAGVPTNAAFGLNVRALWFGAATAIVATLLCGMAPAIHAVRGDLAGRLSGSGKGAGGGHRHGRLRSGLVIAEVALSVLLLTGTGLMVRTLSALHHVDLGFDPKNLLWVQLAMPEGRYDTAEQKRIFFEEGDDPPHFSPAGSYRGGGSHFDASVW